MKKAKETKRTKGRAGKFSGQKSGSVPHQARDGKISNTGEKMAKAGGLRGSGAVKRWKSGARLTRGEAILAQCYECNDGHRSGPGLKKDCKGHSCPLYQYFPYHGM